MKYGSFKSYSKRTAFAVLCAVTVSSCGNKVKKQTETAEADSVVLADTLCNDTHVSEETVRKSLNDIRFANFTEDDWVDNEYVRCLRNYITDYNNGKIEDEALDEFKYKIKGKFAVAYGEPSMYGGLMIGFAFIENPNDLYTAWVYSFVDEDEEKVLDYEVRGIYLSDEKTGLTKEEFLKLQKQDPRMKFW